jgi:hypothetical protein
MIASHLSNRARQVKAATKYFEREGHVKKQGHYVQKLNITFNGSRICLHHSYHI